MIAGMMFFLVRLLMAMIPPLSLKYDAKEDRSVICHFDEYRLFVYFRGGYSQSAGVYYDFYRFAGRFVCQTGDIHADDCLGRFDCF